MKKRVFELISPSHGGDRFSRFVDLLLMFLVCLNLGIVIAYTFTVPSRLLPVLRYIELASILFFSAEYLLRVWTADLLHPSCGPIRARLRYIFSVMALVDLLSIVPFYLPMLIPLDLKVLRSVRLLRLFQLFKLTRYTASLGTLVRVMRKKAGQLVSSFAVVLVMIMISSLLMYSIENQAQPEIFQNAFSGMWWAISTLTTIGYGDIYPITVLGKLIGSIIALLGIGLLAVPTAIISSGFIEQGNAKRQSSREEDGKYCPHCGKKLH